MDEGFQHIGEQLRRITRTQNKFYPLLSGKVVAGSIDNENYTVDVLLTIDSDTDEDDSLNVPSEGVFLGCVSMNNNGILLYPADNSDVIIGSVDGDGNYTLLSFLPVALGQFLIPYFLYSLLALFNQLGYCTF